MDFDENNPLCALLQRVGTAAILVDRNGKVVGLNDAARDCLGGGLDIRNRRLITSEPAAQRALARLIEGGRDGCNAQTSADEQVVVARRHGRPLILRTIRLDGGAGPLCPGASAMVLLLDVGRVSLPSEPQLMSAFGLSCGEARLAICLAAGERLESAASRCGISYETARKRVKGVFEKTDTRRQSELVALVIRIGTLTCAAPAVVAAAMPRVPRPRMIDGRSPGLRRHLQDVRTTSRSDRWKQLSTA
jgi:DNA-binding CsgD family transcriptional regulator